MAGIFVPRVQLNFVEEDSQKVVGNVESQIGLAIPEAGDLVDVPINSDGTEFVTVEVKRRHFHMTFGLVTVKITCLMHPKKD